MAARGNAPSAYTAELAFHVIPVGAGEQFEKYVSNFVFFDAANNVYIGQAAHCSGTGGATETDGCDSGSPRHAQPGQNGSAT